ncbi:hypothetical protein BDV98DRAFT_503657 [Pterulicium gracile]|uniref:BRCA2 OB1 domain-containing protein n=1 Tax=Pterulicium gracile TaxID=1884261 RepID=A0A5C3QSA4_9AGAR|nr:hypothetical protein BDV98DRAFT_503657 [Pterula gracilis]
MTPSRPNSKGPPAFFASTSAVTPSRPTSRGPRPAAFVTPFKQGMKPGQAGHQSLQSSLKKAIPATPKTPYSAHSSTPMASSSKVMLPTPKKKFFDTALCRNLSALKQITPKTALFFSFFSDDGRSLGSTEALAHLQSAGCKDATQAWVDNHWSLILWKLAGMAALNPSQELDDVNRRWCWEEVLRQLLYRYEREINQGARPPLRAIAGQDKSPLSPMVLCISDITWSEKTDEDGVKLAPQPHLEVTDGWYRLRLAIDATLARATHKGLLRPGRKIGVMSANIISKRNEPSEILDAYGSLELQIHGNSCHLAPWHAKLGFQARPWVTTLHKLSPDGGKISLMDLTVVKVHPIAFLESVLDEQGEKKTKGPWSQSEENKHHDAWMSKRERLAESIRLDFTAELERYDGYAARLEAKGSNGNSNSIVTAVDSSRIEMVYDDLEDPKKASAAIQRCTPSVARAVAQFIRAENEKKKEKASEALADELNASCPLRDVSNFRAVTVRDTVTDRRPGNRVAHITIRDVLRVQLYDNSNPGEFKVGDRFMTTNVRPTQPNAWMGLEDGAEIWLSTVSRSSTVVGLKRLTL